MITEIAIHNVEDMEITMGQLPEPAPNCHAINITIKATGVGGSIEVQKISLFVWDKGAQKELADRVAAFNSTKQKDMLSALRALNPSIPL